MSVAIKISFTPESAKLLEQWDGADRRLVDELDKAFGRFLTEAESSIVNNELSGGLVKNRSGLLKQSVKGQKDGPLSGFVGTTQGATTPYARTILGPGTTTIRPVSAKKLWVPVADNLNPSGIANYTPKGLFETFGKDRISIFTSKRGNTVVFLKDEKNADGSIARFKKAVNKGKNKGRSKGDLKGKLMFVLKDQVVIEGTDALAKGVERMMPQGQKLLAEAIKRALPGGGNG